MDKFQIPNLKFQTNSNSQHLNYYLLFGILKLDIVWYLVLGFKRALRDH